LTPLPVADERVVRAFARDVWIDSERDERVLLLRAQPQWDGPATLDVGDIHVHVAGCPSTLSVRAALVDLPEGDRLVVLTDVDGEELGIGLLAHAVRQRVMGLDVWDAVRGVFGVRRPDAVDSALVREGEALARLLVERAPVEGWPPPPGGILTRDFVLRSLVHRVLELPADRIDVAGLLDWSGDTNGVLAYSELPVEARARVDRWLAARVGPVAQPLLVAAARKHGTDAVALGLVVDLLWSGAQGQRAQGRFEQSFLGRTLDAAEAKAWGEASRGWMERRLVSDPASARSTLDRAEEVLRELQAEDVAAQSELLPAGYAARLAVVGSALRGAVAPSAGPGKRDAVESSYRRMEAHRLAEVDRGRVEAALAGVRLVRWLAGSPSVPTNAYDALTWQVVEGGWVDRARQLAWNGDPEPALADGLREVFVAASERRREIDRAAATHIAAAARDDQRPGRVVPVEDAMTALVAPLLESAPVLLLVLDGMSAAVASEVVDHVVAAGWQELVNGEDASRQVLLAGLPSVTEVSRTSLLTGRLARGGQAEERRGFPAAAGASSRLFHLAELAGSAGRDLPVEVRDALLDPQVPVVAAVLNAVDDSLTKGDPARTRWTLDAVRHLRPLLDRAAAAGRTVVLTSDHGHVVDRPDTGEVRSASGGGSRWRPASGSVQNDEVVLEGRRVVLGDKRIVAAVDETLRFMPRKEGYHGGAALAELAIPFVVAVRTGAAIPPGWRLAPPQQPSWWDDAVDELVAGEDSGDSLFGQPAESNLVDELTSSGVLAQAVDSADVHLARAALQVVVAADGRASLTAVARAAGCATEEVAELLERVGRLLDSSTDGRVVQVSRSDDVVRVDVRAVRELVESRRQENA
jgi:hypothetical protein